MGVLHPFSTKNMFYDKMNLSFFIFCYDTHWREKALRWAKEVMKYHGTGICTIGKNCRVPENTVTSFGPLTNYTLYHGNK